MGFIPAKCTQCGANIEVDESKEAGICKYCGTAFVTEKAINNYNTYITNNINVIHQDNPDYICPKCQSSDTKSLMVLKKYRPVLKSNDISRYVCIVMFIGAAAFTIFAVFRNIIIADVVLAELLNYLVNDLSTFVIIILVWTFLFGMDFWLYHTAKRLQKENEQYKQEFEKNLAIWKRSYQCMRCGQIFTIKEK